MKYAGTIVVVVLLTIVGFATFKKVSPVSWGWWGTTNASAGVALHGYDPVAYFDEATPAPGNSNYTVKWDGALWHFKNADNRARFEADPEKYAPQFGGFCAFAVSKGFTADSNPDAWHISDGKLYVFADQNVRDTWVATVNEGSLEQSQSNWAKR